MNVDIDDLRLIGDAVLIEIVEDVESRTDGGIIIPENAVVREASNGEMAWEGVVHKISESLGDREFSVGDLVLFNVMDIKHSLEEGFLIVESGNIYAVLEEEHNLKPVGDEPND